MDGQTARHKNKTASGVVLATRDVSRNPFYHDSACTHTHTHIHTHTNNYMVKTLKAEAVVVSKDLVDLLSVFQTTVYLTL